MLLYYILCSSSYWTVTANNWSARLEKNISLSNFFSRTGDASCLVQTVHATLSSWLIIVLSGNAQLKQNHNRSGNYNCLNYLGNYIINFANKTKIYFLVLGRCLTLRTKYQSQKRCPFWYVIWVFRGYTVFKENCTNHLPIPTQRNNSGLWKLVIITS